MSDFCLAVQQVQTPTLEAVSEKASGEIVGGASIPWDTARKPIGFAIFEPGEDWFFDDYGKHQMIKSEELLPPHSHPENQQFLNQKEE